MKGWVGLGLVVLAASPVMAQQKCVPGEAARRAAEARKIQGELLKEKVVFDTDVLSPELRGGVGRFKAALTAVVDASLSCMEPTATPAAIQATLAGRLGANKPEPPQRVETQADVDAIFDPEDNIYGTSLTVVVAAPSNAPSLRSVIVSFGVECGNDTMLLLYAPKGEYWNDVLRWQSGEFDSISHAFGDFFAYAILPEATADRFRVVVAHGHPWCTSRWSGYSIDLLEPRGDDTVPKVVWHADKGYVRFEVPVRLRATPGGFELRLEVGTIESDHMTRLGIERFRVAGDTVQRIQPIARNGRDFVDEWLQLPWVDAQRFTLSDAVDQSKPFHDAFERSRKPDSKDAVFLEYGPVVSCAGQGKHFQVQMTDSDFDVDEKVSQRPSRMPAGYYQIVEGGDGYMLAGVSVVPDPRCGGPDLMAK